MSARLKVCFNGCSFTVGEGFPEELRQQYIYDRLISKIFNFESVNIAKEGSSNYLIFLRSADAIMSQQYDIVFTQWTALNRLWLFPGPDTEYYTNSHKHDYIYRDIVLTTKEKRKFDDIILSMNHDYKNIFDLIDYCKILEQLAKNNSVKLVHINGLIPWTRDLINYEFVGDLKQSLSAYTQSMLDFDHRDDVEIVKFFQKLQHKFQELDQTSWVNIFDSFQKNAIDRAPEDNHPGIRSHQWMADKILNYLEKNNTP